MGEVVRHPVDFDQLASDMWIEGEALWEAVEARPEDKNFGHRLWSLSIAIERHTAHWDEPLLCRIDHERIRIMTAGEAIEHVERRGNQHFRGYLRQDVRAARVNVEKLTDEQQKRFESECRIRSGVTRAMVSELGRQRRLDAPKGEIPDET